MNGPVTILHVDDDPSFLDLVAESLGRTEAAFTVVTETDPTACLDIIASRDIDCVVSGYDMPGMDGLELLDRVRRAQPDLPFILFTGTGSEEIASEAIAAGVTDYLQKSGGTEQFELLANRIQHSVTRYRTAKRAEDLERIRRVLRDVNKELVRSRSRTELEDGVCQILAAARPYSLAWIGDYDGDPSRIELRASGGDEAGVLQEMGTPMEIDPGGLVGRALQTGEIEFTQDLATGPDDESWEGLVSREGFRSSAAIPLSFEETIYGVLVVSSREQAAFGDAERDLLRELGSDIGHAIHRINQEERYRRLFRGSINGIAVYEIVTDETGDPVDYVFLEVNEGFEELTGLAAATVEGKPVSEVLPDLDPSFIERFGQVALEGETLRFEDYSAPLDRHFDVSAYPLSDGLFVATFSDITAAKKREQELSGIIDQMNDAVFVHEPDGEFLTVNQAAIDRYGYTAAELAEMKPSDLVPPAEHGDPAGRIQRIMDEGKLVFETTHQTKTGEGIPVEINSSKITHQGRQAVLSIARDITTRKEHERALEESERRYRSLFESNPAVIWEEDFSEMRAFLDDIAAEVSDLETYLTENRGVIEEMLETIEVIDVSQQAVERYGADSKAHLIDNLQELFTQKAYEANMEIGLRIQAGERHVRVETATETFDGRRLDEIIDVNVPEPYADDLSRVYLTTTDITERKARERELRSVKERLDLALEAGQLGVWDWDIRTDEVARDERWARMLGHRVEEVEDDLRQWEQKVHPDDLPRAQQSLAGLLKGENSYYESEQRLKTKSGEWKWVREMGRVTEYDETGDPVRAVGVTQDIDEEKRAFDLLERQKEQLDDFATMISHDLRNPLTVAEGHLQLAREEFESENLAATGAALERMDEIIEEVLTLTAAPEDIESETTTSIRLGRLVNATWENVDTAKGSLQVESDCTFVGHETRLRHVFENLFRNAVEHGGTGVSVEVGCLSDGFYVADDGPGIDPSERVRIFESGYSTSPEGTGFGLGIVKKMVEAHGWSIQVTEAATGGARFEVTGIDIESGC